jgi:hypothetical protein
LEDNWEPQEKMKVAIRWGDEWNIGTVRRACKSQPGKLISYL